METSKIQFTRVNNDVNGNPRYVCHFHNLLTESESNDRQGFDFVSRQYEMALKRAKKIGGRKFHNKQYGGGVVFQSYNIQQTENDILNLLNQ
jgi:hypothetical protein